MRLLVIGAGSIGTRHLTTAHALGWDTAAVRRSDSPARASLPADTRVHHDVERAIREFRPTAAIVATPSALHLESAEILARRAVPTLIEKPMATDAASARRFATEHAGSPVGVACNLRFWPALERLREVLPSAGRILTVRVQVGQHLSQWRPGTDHRSTYSAEPALGGGVLLDLIHEIDYAVWTFGLPEQVMAVVGCSGTLGIASEDMVAAVLRWRDGSLGELHLDYLRHHPRRSFEVIGAAATISYDTDRHRLERWTTGPAEILYTGSADDLRGTYAAQLQNLKAVTEGREAFRTSMDDGILALRVADAIRKSAASGTMAAP
jgi:predicted dehydrogenase